VEQVVESNNKKRFELVQKDGVYWIRAVQGHTMQTVKDEDLLKSIDTKSVF
jgi:2'-phosphotransferase